MHKIKSRYILQVKTIQFKLRLPPDSSEIAAHENAFSIFDTDFCAPVFSIQLTALINLDWDLFQCLNHMFRLTVISKIPHISGSFHPNHGAIHCKINTISTWIHRMYVSILIHYIIAKSQHLYRIFFHFSSFVMHFNFQFVFSITLCIYFCNTFRYINNKKMPLTITSSYC